MVKHQEHPTTTEDLEANTLRAFNVIAIRYQGMFDRPSAILYTCTVEDT